ncbi:MAG: serine/threonine-protein kinase, partial [Woeseiaceae bacterium]
MKISEQAAALFAEAQAHPPEGRTRFLTEACGTDKELLDEVVSLLNAADQSEDFFERLSGKVGLSVLASSEPSLPKNKVIGNWRLKHVIGRGGMGAVYLAERADEQFEQQAALKILPFGLDTDAARSRFLTERQILARLEHANIARLLDGGVTDEGTPYFVMDYVDGVPIDSYCDENNLSVDERIRLFLGVLAAVSHAHAHLIVHRDIKPSNVLVATGGNVKLLDFGIAKLLSKDGAVGDTRELGVALTPEFAAPEQLVGGDITTATDVYTLGLLLYTLLAGRNPRPSTDVDSVVALQAVAAEDPPRLSDFATDRQQMSAEDIDGIVAHRKTSLAALRRTLKGDLDNIMQKALAVDAIDRYATAGAFAADLRRFLDDEPVTAQPITVSYRVNKFVRRHRGGVLVASLMLIALVTSTSVTAWQMVEAQRQRDIAFNQQQRVQATNAFIVSLFSEVRSVESPLSPTELLDRGVELLNRNYGAGDRFTASILYDLSTFYSAIGADDKRLSLLDRAAEIARQHDDKELLGRMMCARALIDVSKDPEAARNQVTEGRQILGKIRNASAGARVACLRASGLLLAAEGNQNGAVAEYRAALQVLDESPLDSGGADATLLSAIGGQYLKMGRKIEALELINESIAIRDRIGHGNTVAALIGRFNRAMVITEMGEVLSAAEDQREALARLEKSGRTIIGTNGHYANSLLRLGRYEEALALFMQELAAAQESGNARWVTTNEMQIGRTL